MSKKDIKSIASINQSYDLNEYKYKSYEELSQEFQEVYAAAARAFVLIPQMYNRLTLVDGLTHKEALAKIHNDHNHLPGYTERNIRRYLPANNSNIPKRVRTSRPKNSITQCKQMSKLSPAIRDQQNPQNALTTNDSEEMVSSTNQLRERSTESNTDHDGKHNAELKAFARGEIEFTIPKEKYPDVEEAMQKSRALVYVIFDKNGMLEFAIPDTFRSE